VSELEYNNLLTTLSPARRKYLFGFFAASLIEFGRAHRVAAFVAGRPLPAAALPLDKQTRNSANTLDHLEPRDERVRKPKAISRAVKSPAPQ
jgi:hypothetical protein